MTWKWYNNYNKTRLWFSLDVYTIFSRSLAYKRQELSFFCLSNWPCVTKAMIFCRLNDSFYWLLFFWKVCKKKKENTDEWKGLVKTKHTFAETFKMERVFYDEATQFFIFFPFIWASFSVLAKPYFIMILTMSKIVKLKSGDRLLAEIELFIFFWQTLFRLPVRH